MKTQVFIERLVIEGLDLNARDGLALRHAFQAELARLLAERRPYALASTTLDRLSVVSPHVDVHAPPAAWGTAAARSFYAGLLP